MEPEEKVSTPENEGVVINVDNTPEPEDEETPPVEVEANPTIIVNNITPETPAEETRQEIEEEIREDDERDRRILELEAEVFDLRNPAPIEEPEIAVENIEADNDELGGPEEPEEPESGPDGEDRSEPRSAGAHPLFRTFGDWKSK